MLELRRTSAQRPVDWRWRRAHQLAETRQHPGRTRDDKLVVRALRFILALERCSGQESRYLALAESEPHMFEAWRQRELPEAEAESRYELEARILAAESFDSIAAKLCLTPEAVACYENLFFNVTDRLQNPGYITQRVIGSAALRGLSERSSDCLWKLVGYWGGPFALDFLIYKYSQPARPTHAGGAAQFFAQDISDRIRMKASLALLLMPIKWETQPQILELYCKMLEMERESGGAAARDTLIEGINAVMGAIPWAQQSKAPPVIDAADAGPVSLRAEELMALTSAATAAAPEIDDIKFPGQE